MLCIVEIAGNAQTETVARPISSQSEPVSFFTLTITIKHRKNIANDKETDKMIRQINTKNVLWRKNVFNKRIVKLKIICEYLACKIEHCTISEANKRIGSLTTYTVKLSCNLEWLISVIETELDYHVGKKLCTKKINEKYMQEYMATQLSGFGEKFYHSDDNISKSLIAQVYKMKIPDVK
jgi:hypothetical protein